MDYNFWTVWAVLRSEQLMKEAKREGLIELAKATRPTKPARTPLWKRQLGHSLIRVGEWLVQPARPEGLEA